MKTKTTTTATTTKALPLRMGVARTDRIRREAAKAKKSATEDDTQRALRLAIDMLAIEAKSHRDAQRTRAAIAVEGCIERCRTVLRAAEMAKGGV